MMGEMIGGAAWTCAGRPWRCRRIALSIVVLMALPTVLLVESRGPRHGRGGTGESRGRCGCNGFEAGFKKLLATGEQHSANGDQACAKECLQRAVAYALETSHVSLPTAAEKSGRPGKNDDEASSTLLIALQRLARALYAQRQVPVAAQVLQLASRLVPTSGEVLRGLGQLRRELAQTHAARGAFARALVLEPRNPAYLFSLASLLHQFLPREPRPWQGAHNADGAGKERGWDNDHYEAKRKAQEQHVENLYREAVRLQPNYGDAANNLGNLLRSRGDTAGALDFFLIASAGAPANANFILNLGSSLVTLGRFSEATERFQMATQLLPRMASVYRALGGSLEKTGDNGAAVKAFKTAIRLDPQDSASYLGAASAHKRSGDLNKSIKVLQACPQLGDSSAQTVVNFELAGAILDRVEQQLWGARDAARDDKEDGQSGHKHKSRARGKTQSKKMLKEVDAALALLRQVHHDGPADSAASTRASALEEALRQRASTLRGRLLGSSPLPSPPPPVAAAPAQQYQRLVEMGLWLQGEGKLPEALAKFDEATTVDPSDHEAHNAYAIALLRAGRLKESAHHSRRALALRNEGRFHVNLGAALYEQRDFVGAIRAFEGAVRVSPADATSHLNLANALSEVHMFAASIKHFEHALTIQPAFVEARANMERNKETVCDWDQREQRFRRLRAEVEAQLARGDTSVVRPWHALAYPWPPALLQRMSRSFSDKTLRDVHLQGLAPLTPSPPAPSATRRIVLGYVSYCFSAHPTTYLLGSVFRQHNRPRVHAHCYALNAHDDSQQRAAVERECETFQAVDSLPTADIAELINRHAVHVTINLDGWTSMGRTNEIFALTPAPVQIQYMGYPGSLASPYVPWLLSDRVISPPEFQDHYSEKLLYHAHGYYVNDYPRLFPSHPPPHPTAAARSRREGERSLQQERGRFRLPTSGPVLVNLNNLYKVSPEVFALWVRILQRVAAATLTLVALPEDAQPFLQRSATAALGTHSRLHFVEYLPRMEHLERAALATVFLDTLLVNAHTTAMDVLWAGLPLVTSPDTRFASRVAASVLMAACCTETVAATHDEYVNLAVRLATVPAASRRVRKCLADARAPVARGGEGATLFDAGGWVQGLERLVRKLWDVHAHRKTFHVISARRSA